jgi:hypothetical protein
LKKTHHKKELVEWLKVKALSSSLSTEKKKKSRFWEIWNLVSQGWNSEFWKS